MSHQIAHHRAHHHMKLDEEAAIPEHKDHTPVSSSSQLHHSESRSHFHTHIPHEEYSAEYAFLKKLDDRLFPEHLLYCEGMPRPALRGVLHLICALLLPFAMWHLLREANGNTRGQIAAFCYIGGNFFCCAVSALYHMGKWPASVEIYIQKLDHMGIAICSAGINIPVAICLFPRFWGNLLAFLSYSTCIWACYNVMNNRPGVWRLILCASSIMPFFPLLWIYQYQYEFWSVVGNSVCMAIGAYIFTNRWPDPWPSVFGYHEVFHVFTVLGFLFVYCCNWSVIHRTCNPYALELDVRVIAWKFFFPSMIEDAY